MLKRIGDIDAKEAMLEEKQKVLTEKERQLTQLAETLRLKDEKLTSMETSVNDKVNSARYPT
jgi:hypothetical protein